MSTQLLVLDLIFILLTLLIILLKVKLKTQINVSEVLLCFVVVIKLSHDVFGFIGNQNSYFLITVIPILIYFTMKILAVIYRGLTGDVEDYNKFTNWFG